MNQPFNAKIDPTRAGFSGATHRGVDPDSPEYKAAEAACEPHLRAAMISLFGGNLRAAHAAVERAAEALRPVASGGKFLETPLTEIGFDSRLANALEESLGIIRVRELIGVDRNIIESVPNVGPKMMTEVYRLVAAAAVKRVKELEARIA